MAQKVSAAFHIIKGPGKLFCGMPNNTKWANTITRKEAEELSAIEATEKNVCEECMGALSAMLANTIS